jgi:glyoxylase-like metal-dependent hydrolase (beta-lactamase superfamily II)
MQVIHTPGHTPGSISLLFPSEGLLLVGDALQFRRGKLALPSPRFSDDMAQAKESVRRLSLLDFETVGFSHFPPLKKDATRTLRQFAESLD